MMGFACADEEESISMASSPFPCMPGDGFSIESIFDLFKRESSFSLRIEIELVNDA